MTRASYYISPNLTLSSEASAIALPTFHSELQYGDENDARDLEAGLALSQISPTTAMNTVRIAQNYPWLSPGIVTGAAIAGIEPEDPAMQWLAERQAMTAERGGVLSAVGDVLAAPFTFTRGLTRIVTTGFDFLWEEGLTRPLRAGVGLHQGMDMSTAYQAAGASIGTRAVGQMFGGEAADDAGDRIEAFIRNVTPLPSLPGQGVNLGSGWLPNSDVADENDKQVRALQALYEAQGIPQANAQAQAMQTVQGFYGAPITHIARQQANEGIQVHDRAGNAVSVSPGRLGAIALGMTADTMAFNVVSGLGDFSAQIFLDPSNIALGGLSKARLASRVLTKTTTQGSRMSRVFSQNVDQFRNSAFYRESLLPRLAQMDNPVDIRTALGLRGGANTKEIGSMRHLIHELATGTTTEAMDAALTPHLGTTIRQSPRPTNLANTLFRTDKAQTLGQRVGGSEMLWRALGAEQPADIAANASTFGLKVGLRHRMDGTWLGRLFSEMPDRMIDTSNMDEAYFAFDNWLNSAGFHADEQKDLLLDFAVLGNDDHTGAFQVIKKAMESFEVRIGDGMIAKGTDPGEARAWAKSFTQMYKSQEDWVKYWVDQQGNSQWFPTAKFRVVADGEIHEIAAKPTVHMISELVSRQLPMPDPREMRRVLSEVSKVPVSKLTATRTIKHGTDAAFQANAMTTLADFYMQKVWKPMVLLRFAWPVRVIGEEAFRAGAAGRFSAIRHPMSWLAFATGRKGNRTLMHKLPVPREVTETVKKVTSGAETLIPEYLDEFYGALAASHGGWLTTKGNVMTIAGYQNVDITSDKFIDAWIWNLSKANANGHIIRHMAEEGGIDETANWLLTDGRDILRKLRDAQDGELRSYEQVHQYLQSLEARVHALAGGDYIWWDEVAGHWKDNWNRPATGDLPPPPTDPNQPPLPGMRGGPRTPTPAPGLGDTPYTGPTVGRQGQFDTEFQPRIQRERQADTRFIDLYETDATRERALEVRRAPGVFGDSVPLDRTWANFAGQPTEYVLDYLYDGLRDYRGGMDFAHLGYVDESLDAAVQTILARYLTDEELLVGLRTAYSRATKPLAEADRMYDFISSYRKFYNTRLDLGQLDARFGAYHPSHGLPRLGDTGWAHTDNLTDPKVASSVTFLSALIDDLAATAPSPRMTRRDFLRLIDERIEEMRYMDSVTDEVMESLEAFSRELHGDINPLARDVFDDIPMEDMTDDMFVSLADFAGRAPNDDPVRMRLVRGYQEKAHRSGLPAAEMPMFADNVGGAMSPVAARVPDGKIPKLRLSRIFAGEDQITPDMLSYGALRARIKAMIDQMPESSTSQAVRRNGFQIDIDQAGRAMLSDDALPHIAQPWENTNVRQTHNAIAGAYFPGWDEPGQRLAGYYDQAAGSLLRTGFAADMTAAAQRHLPGVTHNLEAQWMHKLVTMEDPMQVADLLHEWARWQRHNLLATQADHMSQMASDSQLGLSKFNASVLGNRPVRSMVSDILQYGETWKGIDADEGMVMWSENIREVLHELNIRRSQSLAADQATDFEDQVVDAISEIADRLGVDPNALYDTFDDAVRRGQELSGLTIDSAPSYRSPMTDIVMPQVTRQEIQTHTVRTKEAWDALDDDAPVYVYVYASQDEARRLATEGWDGTESLLVSPDPDVASYYTIRLEPSGPGLPGLGHGRRGEPLTGLLAAGKGETANNMYGPGLYSTSNGDVLSGYMASGVFDDTSVTQIRWLGDEPPKIFDLEETLTPEDIRTLRSALARLKERGPSQQWTDWVEADAARRTAQVRATGQQISPLPADSWDEAIKILAADLTNAENSIAGSFPRRLLWSDLTDVSSPSIIANDMVVEAGWDVIRHEGGLNSGGFNHQTHIWPWETLRRGKVGGEALADADYVARSAGKSASNTGKLVAIRTTKGKVQPSVMTHPDVDPADVLFGSGLGGRLDDAILPEQTRIVGRRVTHMEEGTITPYPSQSPLEELTPYRFKEIAGERMVEALEDAKNRGLRVQAYEGVRVGDTQYDAPIVVTVAGNNGQFLDLEITVDGSIENMTNPVMDASGHVLRHRGQYTTTDQAVAAIRRLKANPNGGAWYRTRRTITGHSVDDIRAIDALPDVEGALLREQLASMPKPPDAVRASAQADGPPARFPPNEPPTDIVPQQPTRPEVPRLFHLRGEADPQILELMRNRRFDIDAENSISLPGEGMDPDDALRAFLAGRRDSGAAPQMLPYRKLEHTGEEMGMLDRALSQAFFLMMSRPTNYLSRAPVWKQAYIQRVLELRPFASAAVREKIDDMLYKPADAGGFGITRGEARRILGQTPAELTGEVAGGIQDIRTIDDIAKAFALEETKSLLYDASKRHNISDITRNIFPFAEAWAEVISVWSRIAFEHPEVLRRVQQGIEGARESGIFYENDQGEEVFAYPGLDLVGNWMLGAGDQGSTRFTGRVAGLNIALGGYLPGFGPMVQLPVSMAADKMPVGSGFVKDLVLPFGAADINYQPGDLIDAGLPSWYKRFLQAIGQGSQEWQQTYFNSVIDVFRLKSIEDPRLLNDSALAYGAMQDSFQDATNIGLFRMLATFILPTGPSIEYLARDPDGKNWTLQALGGEYYRLLKLNDGDHQAATAEFVNKFGMQPYTMVTSKTVRAIPMGSTETANQWYLDNKDLFEASAYPTTAAHAMPDAPWEDFSWDAYRRQLEADARQGVNPDVWLWRRNQLIGNAAYQNAKDRLNGRTDAAALTWLRQTRIGLMDEYPGFGLADLPGVPGRATLDQKVAELERWHETPRLAESNAGKGLAVYLELRQQAQIRAMEHGLSPSGFQTAQQMEYIRAWLREQAAVIMATYPDFSALWFDVFAAELEEANAPTEPLTLAGLSFKESA